MVINSYDEESLINIFRSYGEIKSASRLVSEIVRSRSGGAVQTTRQLREIAVRCAPRNGQNKYLARVFQALRIEVNDEIGALKEFLKASLDILKPGGRLVVITYHSLEDRLCKNFMRTGNFSGEIEEDFYGNRMSPFKLINRKVIIPSQQEMNENPRSRSAKLRIAEKI